MIEDEKTKDEFKQKCDELFAKYRSRGWAKETDNDPIYYSPYTISRSGNQADSPEAKKTGHKSPKSIVSRINRDKQWQIDPPPSLATVTDLTRCTIIINSFKNAPSLIKNLGTQMQNLDVSVCNKSKETGYCAIHLKGFNEEGIPFEIQIHTPETFYLKQISEYEYSHYRDFNANEKTNEAKKIEDQEERESKLKEIKEYADEKRQSDQETKDLYDFLSRSMDARIFDESLKQEIEAEVNLVKERFKENKKQGKIPKPEENKYIKKFLKTKVEDLQENLEKSTFIKKILPEAQLQLIENCEKSLQNSFTATIEKVTVVKIQEEREKMEKSEHPLSSYSKPAKKNNNTNQNKEQNEEQIEQVELS